MLRHILPQITTKKRYNYTFKINHITGLQAFTMTFGIKTALR